jgi:hypothetical protein
MPHLRWHPVLVPVYSYWSPREANKVIALDSSHMANLQLQDVDERLREVERKSAGL